MAGAKGGAFRDESLARLSSPERLDQLLTEVDRRSWLPLATFGVLIAGSLTWAVFARVPLNVEGRGVIVRPRGTVEYQAPGAGYLARVPVGVGDEVKRGDVLAEIDRPDLDQQIELAQSKLAELTALQRSAEILHSGDEPSRGKTAILGDPLERTRQLAELIRREERAVLAEERERLGTLLAAARAHSRSLEDKLERQRGMRTQGLIAEQELVTDEEAWLDATARVAGLEAQLAGIKPRELEIEDRYLVRLQRVADFGLELQDYGQQLAETRRELARLEQRRRQEAAVLAEHDGRVLEINVAPGQYLQPGERMGAMEVHRADAPLKSLTYFSVRDGKRIVPRLSSTIRVTPDTVERERFGGIEGEIESVSAYPVSVEHVERVIGNREVARGLIEAGYRIEVEARLQQADTPSGLAWSSSSGPDLEISVGTTTTARVAIERRRPITLVMPYLKTLFGID